VGKALVYVTQCYKITTKYLKHNLPPFFLILIRTYDNILKVDYHQPRVFRS